MVSIKPFGFNGRSSREIIHYDFIILCATIALVICGVLFIYSGGVSPITGTNSNEYLRQIIWASIGVILLISFSFFDYRKLKPFTLYAYILSIILLITTILFGKEVNGARSWLGIGSLGIQSSEFAKLCMILFLSNYLTDRRENIKRVSVFIGAWLIALPLIFLTLLQPDLGTASVFIPITLAMCYISGVSYKHLIFCSLTCALIIILIIVPEWISLSSIESSLFVNIITNTLSLFLIGITLIFIAAVAFIGFRRLHKRYFYWTGFFSWSLLISVFVSAILRNFLKEYQILRLAIFLDPYLDPRGAGWNVIQSKTAIGSGEIFGKGFLNGIHGQYNYLPQRSTDFIFSIIGEEWGFIGGLIIFSLLLIIVLRGITIISTCRDQFGINIGVGIICMILFHFTINVGMTMGVMPITGIPLLFLSHGGSSLLISMVSVGLLINIHQNRNHHIY